MAETDDNWQCPWCRRLADVSADLTVICESRSCQCGALALGAPPEDVDEIIDDAINVFGPIADGYMTEFDRDRIAGLRQIGVEVAGNDAVVPSESTDFRIMWFRRKPT